VLAVREDQALTFALDAEPTLGETGHKVFPRSGRAQLRE
jgi:hypothetical protein